MNNGAHDLADFARKIMCAILLQIHIVMLYNRTNTREYEKNRKDTNPHGSVRR